MDYLESRAKSILGNIGAFLFINGDFVESYNKPINDQHKAADLFRCFCTDLSVQIKLKSDKAGRFEGLHT